MNNEAREARGKFKEINNGVGNSLNAVDKRIKKLTAIFEAARDDYLVIKEGFKPGDDRQSVEVHIQGMNRDIKNIQAARDELAALLGS